MNAKPLLYSALIVALAHTTGCQSWQGASFPLQNATRVPPPGTGTYQMPSGYYNNTNTSSLSPSTLPSATQPPAAQMMQASNAAVSSFQSANSFQPASNAGGSVVPAGFQGSPASASPVASAQFSDTNNPSSSGAAASLSDAPAGETPSLQWQQFDGR